MAGDIALHVRHHGVCDAGNSHNANFALAFQYPNGYTTAMTKFAPFDAADYLDNEVTVAEYLTAALEDPNPDVLLAAVRDVARARGMTQLAKEAGLGRESLYKALTPGAKPRYDTMLKLLHAMGVKLSVSPVHSA